MCPTRPRTVNIEPAKTTVMFPLMSELAMRFAIEKLEPWETFEFIQAWLRRDLTGYPEFTDWLAERQVKGASNV